MKLWSIDLNRDECLKLQNSSFSSKWRLVENTETSAAITSSQHLGVAHPRLRKTFKIQSFDSNDTPSHQDSDSKNDQFPWEERTPFRLTFFTEPTWDQRFFGACRSPGIAPNYCVLHPKKTPISALKIFYRIPLSPKTILAILLWSYKIRWGNLRKM